MKVNAFNAVIAAMIAALTAWGVYALTRFDDLRIAGAIVTFVTLAATGLFAFAVKAPTPRSGTVMRSAAWTSFILFLAENYGMAFICYNLPLYASLNGVALLLLILVFRSVGNSGQ